MGKTLHVLTWNGQASFVQLEEVLLYPGLYLDGRPVAQTRCDFLPPLHLDFLGGEFVQQLL